jgi:Holliday junction DNA helicase RuvA
MISYLKGIVAGIQTIGANRVILTLEVNGLGYDLQVPQRLANQLPESGGLAQIFTHLQIREEVPFLYGFASPAERDLFRHLLTVTGIGAALAIALLDSLELPDLVQAIIAGNTQILIQAPGVGKKNRRTHLFGTEKQISRVAQISRVLRRYRWACTRNSRRGTNDPLRLGIYCP